MWARLCPGFQRTLAARVHKGTVVLGAERAGGAPCVRGRNRAARPVGTQVSPQTAGLAELWVL